MVLVSAFMLLYNIKLHPHKPEELYVNIAAAKRAAEVAETTKTDADSNAESADNNEKQADSSETEQ